MHELYALKETLCDELKRYGAKGDLTTGSLDVVDKLSHTIKNLDKIIEAYKDESYSERAYQGDAYDGNGRSYARGQRRDSMGRYSRRGYSRNGMADKLRELMADAPDDRAREEIRRLADKMEQM